jgi:coenzyme F420 hydrogenase subunit beta
MKSNKSIESVIKNDLCTGCGTCAGICPLSAIEMVNNKSLGIYIPQLDEGRCNECGDCLEACPGQSVDFKQLNSTIFGKQPDDMLLGNYVNCYVGHATDYDIRYNSASGGLVTALLIFALEKRIIDGALVTKMNPDNPFEPLPFIARTIEEITSAARSKYCPVPANIALKEILNAKEGERFAVVGLPCHIHGIRKAGTVNKKLKESIVLHLGIFCGHAPTFLWTEFHLWRKGISKEKIARIDYRGKGWPGGMSISLINGGKRFIPHNDTWDWYSNFCYYRRCTLCCDQAAELADISFGDAWLPEFAGDKAGKSIVICRNKRAKEIVQDAASQGKLTLEQVGGEKVIQSQGRFYSKKRVIVTTFALSRMRHRSIPFYNVNFPQPNALIHLRGLQQHMERWASLKRYLWGLLVIYVLLEKFAVKVAKSIILFGGRIQKLFDQLHIK